MCGGWWNFFVYAEMNQNTCHITGKLSPSYISFSMLFKLEDFKLISQSCNIYVLVDVLLRYSVNKNKKKAF